MSRAVLRQGSDIRDGQWHRLHPLTPVLQGGVIVLGLMTVVVASLWEGLLLPVILRVVGVDDYDGDSQLWNLVRGSLGLTALGAVVFVLLAGAVFWLQWRVHLVRMDDDVIEVKKGIIAKSSRRARLDRVNTIGVRRPVAARLLGLAKLDIQAAGNDATVVLAYLPTQVAQDVRREILAEPSTGGEAHEDTPAERQVEVSLFRYLAALTVSVETLVLVGVVSVVAVFAVVTGELTIWLGAVVALFVYVAYLSGQVLRVGNFVVDSVSGDVRVSLGLLSTSVETIPPERIHALDISQPWPWKLFGWWRLDANLASQPGASNTKAPEHTVILPVATREEVLRVVALCVPEVSGEESQLLVSQMLSEPRATWARDDQVSVVSPPRAKWRLPLSARVTGAVADRDVVLMRRGVWVARLAVVPLLRIQSVSVSAGPWHRGLRLRRVELQSVQGPVNPRMSGIDETEAMVWWDAVNRVIEDAIDGSSEATGKGSR